MARKILLVDGLNCFVRAWAAYPQMNTDGEQVGGTVGFLKTLRKLALDIKPTVICVVWESGGSQRRRKLLPEYKQNRRPEKLNRFYEDDIPDTNENRQHQLILLINALKNVPACQIYVPNCEGDDVIAYLSRGPFRDDERVIASSDKDMYQLLDDKTLVYNLHKKTYVTPSDVFEQYRIKPHNFAIAKTLCGDPTDNVPGIKGVGFKTAAKRFPMLGGDAVVLLDDVFSFCAAHVDESTVYERVLEHKSDMVRNWRLVYLDGSMLSATQASKVDNVVSTFKPRVDKLGLIKLLVDEGINDFDVDSFFYAFNCIDGVVYSSRSIR
jgi:DNA polymerase I